MATVNWSPDLAATVVKRMGLSPKQLGNSYTDDGCPDILMMSNGDFAVIGVDLTDEYATNLPDGAIVGPGERLVVIPSSTLRTAIEAASTSPHPTSP